MEETVAGNFFAENKIVVLLAIAGIVFIGIGAFFVFSQNSSSERGVLLEKAASDQSAVVSSQSGVVQNITVDIEGAVVKPGLYTIAKDSRLQDGIAAAGGLAENADKEILAKSFNLAQKLVDGAKVYIPKVGENPPLQNSSGSVQGASSALININSASSAELDKLSGVGPVTAQKIIDSRPYTDINELVSKKVVSKSVFEKIKEKVSVF